MTRGEELAWAAAVLSVRGSLRVSARAKTKSGFPASFYLTLEISGSDEVVGRFMSAIGCGCTHLSSMSSTCYGVPVRVLRVVGASNVEHCRKSLWPYLTEDRKSQWTSLKQQVEASRTPKVPGENAHRQPERS